LCPRDGRFHPFAEATEPTQAENSVRPSVISMVVPTLLILRRFLLKFSQNVHYHAATIRELLGQLDERFFSEHDSNSQAPTAYGRQLER
jgi:hypothetical protein